MQWKETLRVFGIPDWLGEWAEMAEKETRQRCDEVRQIAGVNTCKVLAAFQRQGVGEGHLQGTNGYGYGDAGREILDAVVADIFQAPSACLRRQIVSGTHAISACLFGNLKGGDELVSLTGAPYDTLLPVIGSAYESPGSLKELGVHYRELSLRGGRVIDYDKIPKFVSARTKMIFLQRSRGYTWRPSLSLDDLGKAIKICRETAPDAVILVDNCYGEFVELKEPTDFGADLVAGSLIKNLGGAIAECGGYIAGGVEPVRRAKIRLTAPGIEGEQGATLDFNRRAAQGLFHAPHIVGEALAGAIWAAWIFETLGFDVSPRWREERTDIIQAVRLNNREAQKAFCRGIQRAGAVDHRADPTPQESPGYRDPILMAGGTFVQGSSIELSADGPVRSPYACYLQGGMSSAHVKVGALRALAQLHHEGFLKTQQVV